MEPPSVDRFCSRHEQPNPDKRPNQVVIRCCYAMALLIALIGASSAFAAGQNQLPFTVSNPKNQKWPADQAERIYTSACDLLGRTIRPEKPPQLRPKFLLVLGADNDEFVRIGSQVEVRLKSWNSPKFAEAVVMVAAREVLQASDLNNIVHQSVSLAQSSVSVSDLHKNW